MKLYTPLVLLLSLLCSPIVLLGLPKNHEPMRLWEGDAPEAHGTADEDVPTLTPYFPAEEKMTGASVVVCPGGGYWMLAGHEGRDYALWLNERGVTAFVLKYRLGQFKYRHPAMMYDVQRAIRTVRYNADAWGLDPQRIGVMGSSAGGHLAATALTHFDEGDSQAEDAIDRVSSRPDIGILCYPVITMGPLTHEGSRANLLGEDPSPELVKLLSNELQVTDATPPTFIWSTADDGVVDARNSLDFARALITHHVSCSLHIYPHGPHGLGLGIKGYTPGKSDVSQLLPWTHELELWLDSIGFLKR